MIAAHVADPHAVLEALDVPVWVYAFDAHRIVWANPAAAALWDAADPLALAERDLGEVSDAVRTRLDAYRRRLRAGEAIDEVWTFYPTVSHALHAVAARGTAS